MRVGDLDYQSLEFAGATIVIIYWYGMFIADMGMFIYIWWNKYNLSFDSIL